jgi:uncharacterized membrane protein HdeD (DUF308 family)
MLDPWVMLTTDMTRYWWLHLVGGVAAIVIALIAIAYPSITIFFLAVLVAIWAFVIGFAEITQAWRRGRATRRRRTFATGVLAVTVPLAKRSEPRKIPVQAAKS